MFQKFLTSFFFIFMLTILAYFIPKAGNAQTNLLIHRFRLSLEIDPVWQSRNDVQIPNNQDGTRFSLVDLVGSGPNISARIYFTWKINERHALRLLLAPLSFTKRGTAFETIRFEGESFSSDIPIRATYKFNSWRLTYHYRFHNSTRWAGFIGFTAKVRDAKIELSQAATSAKKTDVGFVPLFHVRGLFRFNEHWRLVLDVDALAGGPGRAEDASFKLYADISRHWSASFGYRTVEGGADVDEVYNFAWLHYAVASVTYGF